MKNKIKLYLAVGLLSATTGCTDLDVDIKSQLTEFPNSEIAAEAKMADIYYAFRGILGRRYSDVVTLSSDEFIDTSGINSIEYFSKYGLIKSISSNGKSGTIIPSTLSSLHFLKNSSNP